MNERNSYTAIENATHFKSTQQQKKTDEPSAYKALSCLSAVVYLYVCVPLSVCCGTVRNKTLHLAPAPHPPCAGLFIPASAVKEARRQASANLISLRLGGLRHLTSQGMTQQPVLPGLVNPDNSPDIAKLLNSGESKRGGSSSHDGRSDWSSSNGRRQRVGGVAAGQNTLAPPATLRVLCRTPGQVAAAAQVRAAEFVLSSCGKA